MNITVVSLLVIGLYLIVMYIIDDYKRQEQQSKIKQTEAPQQKEMISLLDYQFDDANFPSTTYSQMFYSSTPWLHGRGLGDGKTFIIRDANIPQTLPELSQNELNQIMSTPAPALTITTQPTT